MENTGEEIKEKIDDIWESLKDREITDIPSIQDYLEDNNDKSE